MGTRLLGLALAAAAYEVGEAAEANVETAAFELVAYLVRGPLPPTRMPHWLSRAKEFLEASAKEDFERLLSSRGNCRPQKPSSPAQIPGAPRR